MIQEIIIPLEVVPTSRPRVGKHGTYYLKKYSDFIKNGKKFIRNKNLKKFYGVVKVNITFLFKIRKSWSKKKKLLLKNSYHVMNKDLDNCIKSVLDLFNGVTYLDDCQVAEIHAIKKWCDEEGSIIISFEEIGGIKK